MQTKTVKLSNPVMIDGAETKEIQLREPTLAALSGLEVSAVIRGQVDQLMMLLPKISDLTESQCSNLGFRDIATLSMAVVGFLAPSE